MTDASYSADLPGVDDAPPDGVDLTRTPLAGDPFGSPTYDPSALKVDLYDNARKLFDLYGPQMQGVGDDADAFVNAMQGRDAKGQKVQGWRVYNSDKPAAWEAMAKNGISQMQRDLPLYLPTRTTRVKGQP